MESRERSIRHRISEELARSELETMETDARFASFNIAVREYQRQSRDAVNQVVQESSESYEVLMMLEKEGRMEEK